MNTSQFLGPEGIIGEERAQVKQGSENVLVVYSLCAIDLDIAMLIHLIAVYVYRPGPDEKRRRQYGTEMNKKAPCVVGT